MKIWTLNHYATEASTGGMWGRHYNLSQELKKREYEVSVLASGYLHNHYCETREYGSELFDTEVIKNLSLFKK